MKNPALHLICATVVFVVAGVVSAAGYPDRPIRFITPAQPGGTTDILARMTGARLTEVLKQQVIVDNRASANGVIAGDLTSRITPVRRRGAGWQRAGGVPQVHARRSRQVGEGSQAERRQGRLSTVMSDGARRGSELGPHDSLWGCDPGGAHGGGHG